MTLIASSASVRYRGATTPALNGVDFELRPGELVAVGLAHFRDDPVESRCHLVGRVPRDVLPQRGAVDLAA